MAEQNRTLRELATLDVAHQPLCIQYPEIDEDCEDPQRHLKEFHVFYSIVRPHIVSKDYIKMKHLLSCLLFSLQPVNSRNRIFQFILCTLSGPYLFCVLSLQGAPNI